MTDAFDRLKRKNKPSVPPRDASLVKKQNDSMTEISHSMSEISQADQDVEPLPEVVRRTVRIEEEIDSQLNELCQQEKITKEVFLEAAYELCQQDTDVLEQVLEIAKSRYVKRKTAGEIRKLKTMEKKLRSR